MTLRQPLKSLNGTADLHCAEPTKFWLTHSPPATSVNLFARRTVPTPTSETLLVYAMLPHGAVVWIRDEHGVAAHRIDVDIDTLRTLADRFGELCSTSSSSLAITQAAAR